MKLKKESSKPDTPTGKKRPTPKVEPMVDGYAIREELSDQVVVAKFATKP